MALIVDVVRAAVSVGLVPSIVVLGRMVLNILGVEAVETVSVLVGVLVICEVVVTEEVENTGSVVAKEV